MRESVLECLIFADGDHGNAETLIAAIQERGVRATRSAQPRECLDLFGRRRWRFLIVDAGGDIPSSLAVLARAREARPDIPALMLVRRGDVATTVQAMKAGAVNCLETPIQPGRLPAVVDPLCGARTGSPTNNGCL